MATEPRWDHEAFKRLAAVLKQSLDEDEIDPNDIARMSESKISAIRHVLAGRHYPAGIPDSAKEIARAAGWPPGWLAKVLDGTESAPPPKRHPLVTGHSAYGKSSQPEPMLRALERAEGWNDVQLEDLSEDDLLRLSIKALTALADRRQAAEPT